MRYFDTSVLVAYLVNEAHSAKAEAALTSVPGRERIISDWGRVELVSALGVKVRTQQLSQTDATTALSRFERIADRYFTVCPIVGADYLRAQTLLNSFDLGLRAGDALHIAIAERCNAALCCLDKRMAEAANHFGIEVELIL
ncbi:MAG: type II toxin-antitoxin system VapC family toxin [Sulfuricella sp.]|jgi:predicted nucleic acid-binding protein|nr:type II toxin-antitoxin system VapC family toxin [Sulfuricella sp.]